MEKMKKDGTPAKKPGPKPKDGIAQVKVDGALRIETPEADMIEIVETPEGNSGLFHGTKGEKAKMEIETPEVRPLTFDGMEISALRHQDLGEFYFDKKFNSIDWRTIEGDEVSMSPAWWKQLIGELPKIMKLLGVDL